MANPDSQLIEKLRACAKDDQSFEKLKDLFSEVSEERDRYKRDLSLLESAIRNDYDSILITDLEIESPGPRIVYVNPGFTKMTGYSREEVIGKTPRILQGPKTDPEVLDQLKHSLQEGKSFFGQTVNYRKDGSEFINQWDIHPLVDEEGNITHWVSYQHDITERKRAEQALLERNVDTDDLYESSKRTLVDFDADSNILFANKAFRELTGYDKDELSKMKIWDLIPDKQKSVLEKEFSRLLSEKQENAENKYRLLLTRKNGAPIQVEFAVKFIKDDSQAVLRAEVNNISLRKKVLKTLEKRNQKFSSMFSDEHDITYGVTLENDKPVFKWISGNISNLTGYTREECLDADGWENLIHPDDRQLALDHLKKAKSGRSSCENIRFLTKSGEALTITDYAKISDENPDQIRGSVNLADNKETSDD